MYDFNIHTHFNAPKAKGETFEFLNGPTEILLVADNRVWFIGDYVLEHIEGIKRESPHGATGECIWSYPVEGCNFFDAEGADAVSACIDADEKLLRYAE